MPQLRRPFLSVFAAALAAPSLAFAIGSTPVTVVNPADIAKAQGIQQPYQVAIFCASGGVGCGGDLLLPSAQRLVIEYAPATAASTAEPSLADISITTNSGGAIASHYISQTSGVSR